MKYFEDCYSQEVIVTSCFSCVCQEYLCKQSVVNIYFFTFFMYSSIQILKEHLFCSVRIDHGQTDSGDCASLMML